MDLVNSYKNLLKKSLVDGIYGSQHAGQDTMLTENQLKNANDGAYPRRAHTMIGYTGLDNIDYCIQGVIENKIPGDFVETGIWRGGASIYMACLMKLYGLKNRLFPCDSFEGLPRSTDPHDANISYDIQWYLAVSLEKVIENFKAYGLEDMMASERASENRICFLKGWFKDTLADAPFEKIAILRFDGDLYCSTMDVFENCYHKVSKGGYVIVDDYGAQPECKTAIDEFRAKNNITEPLIQVNWTIFYWIKD